MSLPAGRRLGPYEIVAPIGAGGMGEVYRAKDTRLQRDVAIKVVPESIAADPAALARFEREAQAVAALSHPNIMALHDVGRDGDTTYAVMELLSGKTLRETLQAGPLPLRKALDYGRQIADGLAAAHERGIVHRDLKPENVFITTDGRAKLLDFGLALMQDAARTAPPTDETMLGTVKTSPGTVLGTVGYMAPEQVRGLGVDTRADIFAFGAVLYEMACGTRAFGGATAADTLSAILTQDPAELPSNVGASHPGLDTIIRRALEKEPAQRFHSARDLGFALEAIATGSSSAARSAVAAPVPSRRRVAPVAAALVAGAALGAGGWWAVARPVEQPAPVQRFAVSASEFQVGYEWVAASPSGTTLAWGGNVSATATQNLGLWVRHLDRASAEAMRGTADVRRCAFMDEVRLLCLTENQYVTIDITNWRRTVVWTGDENSRRFPFRGLSIAADGRIAAGIANGIAVIEHGTLKMVAQPESGERGLGYPNWTPDGKSLLFAARGADGVATAYVMPVTGGARTALNLPPDFAGPWLTQDGHVVLYGQAGNLLAQPVTADWQLDGAPIRVASELSMDANSGFMSASATPSGMLVYRAPSAAAVQFERVDRAGRLIEKIGPVDSFANFDVAPDGRVAITRREPFINGNSLWMFEPARQAAIEIGHFDGQSFSDPTFSPDGATLAFRRGNEVVIRTLKSNTETVARKFLGYPDSWSRDGRYLTAGRPVTGGYDAWVLDLTDPSQDRAVVTGMLLTDEMRFSPNGKWIAFHAAQKATPEVYVIPFTPGRTSTDRIQITTAGGIQPRWSHDGTELFYLDLTGQLMAVPIPGGDAGKPGVAQALFRTGLNPSSAMDQIAVSADGKGFLLRRPVESDDNEAPVQVVLNWRGLLKR